MSTDTFAQEHAEWHQTVEASRTAPYGPLSATALYWLTPEPQRFAEAPGLWSADAEGTVTLEASVSEEITLNGDLLEGTVALGPIKHGDSLTLVSGDTRLELAERSGAIILRPRHPESPTLVGYEGTGTFPPSEQWVITGRFVPNERDQVEVDTAISGAQQHYDSPGVAEFTIGGDPYRLTLFPGFQPGALRALFADATGADLTFPASRSVGVTRGDDDTVVIDFNRATNPPCAYVTAATCPFPPPENRLPVRIEAGELRPGVRLESAD